MSTLIGRVGIVDRGEWSALTTDYSAMDMVRYNNSIYTAKQAVPTGTLPTNTTYWQVSVDANELQPKTMSSPVTIGGESKTTVEAAVGALEDVKADKTAISSVETTSTAVAAHAVGSYFINASGQFVKTTSAITVGDTIIVKPTVGYNCEATTVGDVLKALNDTKQDKIKLIATVEGGTKTYGNGMITLANYYNNLTAEQKNTAFITSGSAKYELFDNSNGFFSLLKTTSSGAVIETMKIDGTCEAVSFNGSTWSKASFASATNNQDLKLYAYKQ